MKISYSMLFNFVFATMLLVSPFVVGITSSAWDSWLDTNDDGIIDITDIATIISNYGTMGDTTKNVNVTNWPISDDVNVWWGYHMSPSRVILMPNYETSGFGQLHVLAQGNYLGAGESVVIEIIGILPNFDHSGYLLIPVYTFTLTPTSYTRDITIPCPSGKFTFRASTDAVSDCEIYLSFYLTWA